MIELTVEGPPVALKRHRHTKSGHTYDPSKKDKADFLTQVENMKPKFPLEVPISMSLMFYIARPKAHYRTGKYSNLLKNTSPTWCIKRPDIDNYIKLVLDALNGVFYKDDSQVCVVNALKAYSSYPKTIVRIKACT